MAMSLELGVIGNCQVSALIDRYGQYVWTCLPRLDGDPVFCSLLNHGAPPGREGSFRVDLQGKVQSKQSYERNTAVLETLLTNEDGAGVQILDFCPRFRQYGRNFRPVMLVRIVRPLSGHVVINARLRPAANYGEHSAPRHTGSNHVRFEAPGMTWRLTTDMSLSALLEERPFVLRAPVTFIFGEDEPVTDSIETLAIRFLENTRQYWRDWTRELAVPFEWQAEVIRAAITLKLCSFEDTGAVVAALTTSVPESAGSGRTWDYRYCWLRDSYFTIHALNRLGATRTMEGYLRYITNVFAASRKAPLQPVYCISGESSLPEHSIPHLAGYRGMGPVRVGNLAYQQNQHDVYGSIILAATQTFVDQRLEERAGKAAFEQLEFAGEQCWLLYDQPDAGIWEYRGRAHIHTFSSVMCWAGVDRLARIARHIGLEERSGFWHARAAVMHERIMNAAWDESIGCFIEGWGVPTLDASVLLLAELRFVLPSDGKFIATVNCLEKRLLRGHYMMRYASPDDFGLPENAFNVCTFWYVNALASIGRKHEARALFENMLARCNHLGMLSEDIDPVTGELWGNFPQTYSMVGIITAAMRLSRAWEDAL